MQHLQGVLSPPDSSTTLSEAAGQHLFCQFCTSALSEQPGVSPLTSGTSILPWSQGSWGLTCCQPLTQFNLCHTMPVLPYPAHRNGASSRRHRSPNMACRQLCERGSICLCCSVCCAALLLAVTQATWEGPRAKLLMDSEPPAPICHRETEPRCCCAQDISRRKPVVPMSLCQATRLASNS